MVRRTLGCDVWQLFYGYVPREMEGSVLFTVTEAQSWIGAGPRNQTLFGLSGTEHSVLPKELFLSRYLELCLKLDVLLLLMPFSNRTLFCCLSGPSIPQLDTFDVALYSCIC